MSKIITNPKNYSGQELDQIFFRPILSGPSAQQLGIRILYNMPVPTTINMWRAGADPLKPYASGWVGGNVADKFQKSIPLKKVKAEMGYAAADYFNMVMERVSCSAEYNMGELSGSTLEAAETELFKNSIAEGLRATMWVGDIARTGRFNTFDGLLKSIKADTTGAGETITMVAMTSMATEGNGEKLLRALYEAASPELRSMKGQGQLAFMVTRDVYENYESTLLTGNLDSVRYAKINGIEQLSYRGIPVIDLQIDSYLGSLGDLPKSWALLTDRRNLTLAVNTNDLPGSEVALWYNPDEIENRCRAIFLAGTEYLLPELVVASFSETL